MLVLPLTWLYDNAATYKHSFVGDNTPTKAAVVGNTTNFGNKIYKSGDSVLSVYSVVTRGTRAPALESGCLR